MAARSPIVIFFYYLLFFLEIRPCTNKIMFARFEAPRTFLGVFISVLRVFPTLKLWINVQVPSLFRYRLRACAVSLFYYSYARTFLVRIISRRRRDLRKKVGLLAAYFRYG